MPSAICHGSAVSCPHRVRPGPERSRYGDSMSASSHGPMSAGGTSSRASPRSLGPRPRPSTRSARAAAAPSTSIAGTKAPSTAQPRTVAAVAMTRVPRRAASAKPAATRGSRMAATTAPRRPPPTAVATTAVVDQARAAIARGHRECGDHPAQPRYAVSVASGRARPSSAATAAPTGELAGSAPGRCSPTQARARQHRQVRALLTRVAQRRAVPAVEPGMPQRAGVGPHADQLAAGHAGLETVQQACRGGSCRRTA